MTLALIVIAALPDGGFTPIQCEAPQVHLKKPLFLSLKSSSRPLAQLKKGDEAVVTLTGANGSVVTVDEVVLRFEPDANLEVVGPKTATVRHVPYATQEKDVFTAKVKVRLKADGGWLRVFDGKRLATVIGVGNRADDAPPLKQGGFADVVARALEPCVRESMHCFASFDGLKLTVGVTFASSGAVQSVRVDGVSELIGGCFKERLARLTVPPFEGEPFEVQVPLVMSDQPHALLQPE
jgi:hypothetical protein